MFPLLESTRLFFRPVDPEDFEFLCRLQQDSAVMKHIGPGGPRTPEQTRLSLDRALAQRSLNENFGMWIAEKKSSHQPVGNFILREPSTVEKIKGIEIGFSFVSEQWGLGFATESILIFLEFLAKNFPDEQIVAITHLDNLGSQKSLIKTGFQRAGFATYHDPSTHFSQSSALFLKASNVASSGI